MSLVSIDIPLLRSGESRNGEDLCRRGFAIDNLIKSGDPIRCGWKPHLPRASLSGAVRGRRHRGFIGMEDLLSYEEFYGVDSYSLPLR